jgi:hypothetical protein
MKATGATKSGAFVTPVPFMQRDDVIRSRAETDAVVQKTKLAYQESKVVTTKLLSLIEEFRNG